MSPDGSSVVCDGNGSCRPASCGFRDHHVRLVERDHALEEALRRAAQRSDNAVGLAMSPSGKRVFVIGSTRARIAEHIATVGYAMADGGVLWTKRFIGEGQVPRLLPSR